MNKIDEASNEFEYSSGWKKMIKDTQSSKINEEFRVKIEDLQMKLQKLNLSIEDLAQKKINEEKKSTEDMDKEQIIMQRLDKFEAGFVLIENEIKNIGYELLNHKKVIENQNTIIENLIDILNKIKDIETSNKKGFLANIFNKK